MIYTQTSVTYHKTTTTKQQENTHRDKLTCQVKKTTKQPSHRPVSAAVSRDPGDLLHKSACQRSCCELLFSRRKMERCVSSLLLALMMQAVTSVPLIHAPEWGALQGVSVQGDGGRTMNAYLAIPYAVPPVGERRFEKPEPHPGPGEGVVFEANTVMPACPQAAVLIGSERAEKGTSEDCLMLDVYVPVEDDTATATKPYAVMVFFHGGTFVWGNAASFRPSKLVVDGKVIVVIIQYRLGVLGFLTSGDDAVPENLGLWDQNLALRWVKANIKGFGGDPDRITIFGQSAGSWSVALHLISPLSKGLFKRAIMQSGAPQYLFHFMDFFQKKAIFKNLTDLVGCLGDSSQQRLECLKQQPLDHLMRKSAVLEMASQVETYYFPVLDGEFIPRTPGEVFQDQVFLENAVGDVDVTVGFNKQEGAFITFFPIIKQMSNDVMYTADFFKDVMDLCFIFSGLSGNTVLKKTAEFFYRRAEAGSKVSTSLDALEALYGDCIFNVAIIEWARYLAAAPHSAARYMYLLDHHFAFNDQGPIPGAHHGDELMLLFDTERESPDDAMVKKLNKTFLTSEEQTLSAKLVQLWTTFAKTGNPSPPIREDLGGEWPQFTAEEEDYLSFSSSPRVVSKMGPYRDRAALWLNLLPELDALLSQSAPDETAEDQPTAREEL